MTVAVTARAGDSSHSESRADFELESESGSILKVNLFWLVRFMDTRHFDDTLTTVTVTDSRRVDSKSESQAPQWPPGPGRRGCLTRMTVT